MRADTHGTLAWPPVRPATISTATATSPGALPHHTVPLGSAPLPATDPTRAGFDLAIRVLVDARADRWGV